MAYRFQTCAVHPRAWEWEAGTETREEEGLEQGRVCYCARDGVTPQIRDVTGQRQTYTYASEALIY